MRLLDLFCGAGGAAVGYHRAGFEVVGVDHVAQKNYPFPIIVMDALEAMDRLIAGEGLVASDGRTYYLSDFDVVHASPPCQAFTALRTAWNGKRHPDLLTPTLRRLCSLDGTPWVVENVPGAPLQPDVMLCGTMFGLGIGEAELRRHRLFQHQNVPLMLTPSCAHGTRPITIGVYGQHGRDRRRGVQTFFSVADGRQAMGIDWMTGDELSQAIPPAYTFYIGTRLMEYLLAGKGD